MQAVRICLSVQFWTRSSYGKSPLGLTSMPCVMETSSNLSNGVSGARPLGPGMSLKTKWSDEQDAERHRHKRASTAARRDQNTVQQPDLARTCAAHSTLYSRPPNATPRNPSKASRTPPLYTFSLLSQATTAGCNGRLNKLE